MHYWSLMNSIQDVSDVVHEKHISASNTWSKLSVSVKLLCINLGKNYLFGPHATE